MSPVQQTPAVHTPGAPSPLDVGRGQTPARLACEERTAGMPPLTWTRLADRRRHAHVLDTGVKDEQGRK